MKNDLTTGTWQDDIWCPIIIILFCTSDVFSPGCPISWWNHLMVWTTIDSGNTCFSNRVEWDLSYNRWCHQHCHLVVNWPSCLNYLLVKQAVVCPAAAIHKCEQNSMDFDPDVKLQVSWDNTQYIPKIYHHKDKNILDPRNTPHSFFIRNLCGLYEFISLRNLSRSNQAMEPWIVVG